MVEEDKPPVDRLFSSVININCDRRMTNQAFKRLHTDSKSSRAEMTVSKQLE